MSQVNVFISHSWKYDDQYRTVNDWLEKSDLRIKNYSVPLDDPIHNAPNDKALYEAIKAQIRPASCVIILAGVYASYSKWIQKEIEIAQEYGKKIIAVEGYRVERTSKIVMDAADEISAWRSDSLINAIKR